MKHPQFTVTLDEDGARWLADRMYSEFLRWRDFGAKEIADDLQRGLDALDAERTEDR